MRDVLVGCNAVVIAVGAVDAPIQVLPGRPSKRMRWILPGGEW